MRNRELIEACDHVEDLKATQEAAQSRASADKIAYGNWLGTRETQALVKNLEHLREVKRTQYEMAAQRCDSHAEMLTLGVISHVLGTIIDGIKSNTLK